MRLKTIKKDIDILFDYLSGMFDNEKELFDVRFTFLEDSIEVLIQRNSISNIMHYKYNYSDNDLSQLPHLPLTIFDDWIEDIFHYSFSGTIINIKRCLLVEINIRNA